MSTKKLSKNILIYGTSNVLKSLVPFVMLPILTHYLSAEGVGTLSLIETSLLLISPIALMGLDTAIGIDFFQKSKDQLANYIGNGLLVSVLISLLMGILFWIFKFPIENAFEITGSLLLLLPLFAFLRIVPTAVLVLFQSQQKPISYLTFSVGQTVIDFALSALLVILLRYGYVGRIVGVYGAFLIATLIGLFYLFRNKFIDLTFSKTQIKSVINFGLPLIPHAIGGTIIAMSDRYFISFFENNAQVGIYTVAYQLGAIMLLVSMSVNQAWTPMAFSMMKERHYSQVRKLSALILILFVAVILGIYLTRNFIFNLLIADSFNQAQSYIPLLLLGFFFQSCYFIVVKYLFYYKKTRVLASITFSGALVNLVLNYWLINQYQVMGVAYATAITWCLICIVTFMVSYKYFFQVD
jgi:O-antigen/teichoic acid export membrane protein